MGILLTPFALLLRVFYDFAGYGIALILFAIVVKTVFFPITLKGKKSMIKMNLLSGKMQQLQKQYGKDRERYNLEVQKLYEREKVNPMGGCLWSFFPLILMILLYYIIREPLTYLMNVPGDMIATVAQITGIANEGAYPQIAMLEAISNDAGLMESVKNALGEAGDGLFPMDLTFLGINLARIPSVKFWEGGLSWGTIGLTLLPLISTVASFLSMRVSMATNRLNRKQEENRQMESTNRMMMIMMPLMSLWIGFTVPAGLSIYWIAQYVVTMVQEIICARLLKKDYEAAQRASEERERREKEEEKRRKEEARLERARRIEEEKKNRGKKKPGQKKDDEPEQDGVNRDDSREGIRAYARGRAYIPGRFGAVTPYRDPNELMKAQQAAQAEAKGRKKKKGEAQPEPSQEQAPASLDKEPLPASQEAPAPQEQEDGAARPEDPVTEAPREPGEEPAAGEEEAPAAGDETDEEDKEV